MAPGRRPSSFPFLPLPLLIILLPILFFIFLFFSVPPILSLASEIVRPFTVKKSWNSFNAFLVLFAILCGVFARRNEDVSSSTEEDEAPALASGKGIEESAMAPQWPFVMPERKIYDPLRSTPERGMSRLRRSSSSYPDLKQLSLIQNGDDKFQSRFFDDFDVYRHRSRSPEKVIPVDTFRLRSLLSVSPPRKSLTQPPPPPPVTALKQSRTYHSIRRKKEVAPLIGEKSADIIRIQTPTPPPPPPLPPSPARVRAEEKYQKGERKKSNAKKEIAMVLASIYKQRKRKKKEKKQKVDDDVALSFAPDQPVYHTRPPPSPPPPPPPLPPPPSMFHGFFKKASRSKKIHSIAAPPSLMSVASVQARSSKEKNPIPPPSPPPRSSMQKNSTNNGRPPLPTKVNSFADGDEIVNTGGQSPFIPIPPPLPPFKMAATKFVVRGDFARIHSGDSSLCNSPEREAESPSIKDGLQSVMKSEDKGRPVFCPSPDVNTKADNFIARLRDEWRLEKVNSMKEKTQ